MKIAVITFLVNQNYNEAFRDVYFFRWEHVEQTLNLALAVVLVLESQGLYSRITSDLSAIN